MITTYIFLFIGFLLAVTAIFFALRPPVEDITAPSPEVEPPEHRSRVGIGFYDLVETLPEEYWDHFAGGEEDRFFIPRLSPAVGNMVITLTFREVNVRIGEHTEAWFPSTKAAFELVRKVLTDKIVFRIESDETRYYPIEDFEKPQDAGPNDYVWSGSLRSKLLSS